MILTILKYNVWVAGSYIKMQILATNQLGSRKFWPQPIYFEMAILGIKYQPIRLIWQLKLEFLNYLENKEIGY